MIEVSVRRAADADLVQLEELEGVARRDLVSRRGGPRWLETHAPISPRWLDRADMPVWVGTIDRVVVGYLALLLRPRVATIDQVYVMPEAREVGFGEKLLEAAIAHGRDAGASWLEGEALPGDRDTKNLFERAGIKARLITVSAPL